MILNCKFCGKECKNENSLRNHERCCPDSPDRNYKNGMKGKTAWNKGLTKETDVRVKKNSLALKGKPFHNKFSENGLRILSEKAKERNLGGYKPHPNRGVYYKGIWLDSKWEETLAISLDQNNIEWERPRGGFIWNEEGRKYYPDFYLPSLDIYLDPKNSYLQKKDEIKIKQAQERNKIRVLVLDKHQLSWQAVKELVRKRL